MSNIGETIAKLRKKKGLTQAQLGKELNVSYQAVSKWENNQAEPDLQTLEKLVHIFDLSIAEFIDMSNKSGIENMVDSSNDKIVNEKVDLKKSNIFFETIKKPWFLISTLSVLIVTLLCISIFCSLDLKKYSSDDVYNSYNSSMFSVTLEDSTANLGTGFFIDSNGTGIILMSSITNSELNYKIKTSNKEKFDISVLGVSDNIAIIKIDAKNTKPVRLGNSNGVEIGNKVYSLTYKSNQTKSVITEGLVYKVVKDDDGVSTIETYTYTNGGTNGGALFDEHGRVVGIIDGSRLGELNTCIPINKAKSIKRVFDIPLKDYLTKATVKYLDDNNNVLYIQQGVKKGTSLIPSYSKNGYIVDGYYLDAEHSEKVEKKYLITADTTFYVDIRPIEYTISFISNSNQPNKTQTLKYDEVANLDLCEFTRDYFEFDCWQCNELSRSFSDGEQILNLTNIDEKVFTFNAKWKNLSYSIIYVANDGTSVNNYSATFESGTEYRLINCPFTKYGYTFSHWECEGQSYSAGEYVSNLSLTPKVFYFVAIWEPITYNIYYRKADLNFTQKISTVGFEDEFVVTNFVYDQMPLKYVSNDNIRYYVGDIIKSPANIDSNNNCYFDITFKGEDFYIQFVDERNDISFTKLYDWGNAELESFADILPGTGYNYSYYSRDYDLYFDCDDVFYIDDITIEKDQVFTLYVIWVPIEYDVIVHGVKYSSTIHLKYDQEFTFTYYEYSKEGYDLINFSAYVDNEFICYIDYDVPFKNLVDEAKTVDVYVNYEKIVNNTYNYYIDGELYDTQTVKYGEYFTTLQCPVTKPDMWFNGWIGEDIFLAANDGVTSRYENGVCNLHAKWSKVLKGDGTEESPYLIETVEDFRSITYLTVQYSFWGKYFKLVNNLDFENGEVESICKMTRVTFDGNNKLLKNVRLMPNVENNSYSLFSYMYESTIKNLGLKNYIIEYSGGVLNDFAPLCNKAFSSTIDNCFVEGKMCFSGTVLNISGLCVRIYNTHISNCYTNLILDYDSDKYIFFGCFDPRTNYNSTVQNCYAIVNSNNPRVVDAIHADVINGFVGYLYQQDEWQEDVPLENYNYFINTETETVVTVNYQDVCDLQYLVDNLNFDDTIWQVTDGLPKLKLFEEDL